MGKRDGFLFPFFGKRDVSRDGSDWHTNTRLSIKIDSTDIINSVSKNCIFTTNLLFSQDFFHMIFCKSQNKINKKFKIYIFSRKNTKTNTYNAIVSLV